MSDNPSTEEHLDFKKGCFGMVLVALFSIGVAVAFGYGAMWLLDQ